MVEENDQLQRKEVTTEAVQTLPAEARRAVAVEAARGLSAEQQGELITQLMPTQRLTGGQITALTVGGTVFLLAAFASIAALVLTTTLRGMGYGPEQSFLSNNTLDMVNQYSAPMILLLAAVLCSVIGYLLLRAAGAADKQVIPQDDRPLLTQLLLASEDEGIDKYIRLSSLSGLTGFFTKIGLSGLPLATIALTLVFTLLSLRDSSFGELAKLTLGVFLGSYVQRHADREANPTERRNGQ